MFPPSEELKRWGQEPRESLDTYTPFSIFELAGAVEARIDA